MTLPKFSPLPMLELRDGPIDIRSLPVFKEKWKKSISGCRGGVVICSVVSRIKDVSGVTCDDINWLKAYYADINVVGYMGGNRSIVTRGATGCGLGRNLFDLAPTEDLAPGSVCYRWSIEDGETWDEIAVEAREMTMGCAAQPTFDTGTTRTDLLTLDLYISGRAW